MLYDFKCTNEKCNNEETICMSMSEYTGEYTCPVCKCKMVKNYEKAKPIFYGRNQYGFYGVSSN